MNKKNIFFFIFFITPHFIFTKNKSSLAVNVSAQKHAKIKVVLCVADDDLKSVAQTLQKDFSFSGQCAVTTKPYASLDKKALNELLGLGYALAVVVNQEDDYLNWQLYDLTQAKEEKTGTLKKRGKITRTWAHNLADALWPKISGEPGFFSSKIAYCKDEYCPGKRKVKHIYVADYDGQHGRRLVGTPTVNIAPRWNNDRRNPLLFYSEHTNENLRLMTVTMKGEKKVASSFDGINMLPAFSSDGRRVVYCASQGQGHCELYYYDKGTFSKVTKNGGNNISPTFADDASIFFCSDFQTRSPQIYWCDLNKKKLKRITRGGYCAAPVYSPRKKMLAYIKMERGVGQIFTYDLKNKKHTQLTFDGGSKDEPSWSPCGNYLLFSVEHAQKSKIAMLNLLTNKRRVVASGPDFYSYPSWSFSFGPSATA